MNRSIESRLSQLEAEEPGRVKVVWVDHGQTEAEIAESVAEAKKSRGTRVLVVGWENAT